LEIRPGLPLRKAIDGVRLTIRLTPRARAERIDGVRTSADGTPALSVSVTAPPAENRANEALLLLLARALKVPRRDLSLIAGTKSRDKMVSVAGDPATIAERLTTLLAAK